METSCIKECGGGAEEDAPPEHSLQFLEMAFRTDRHRILKNPDGYGTNARQCGDTVEIFLSIRDGRIETLAFQLQGCLNTNACVNTLAEMAEGRTEEEAWKITPEMLNTYLRSLPPDHFHCAELAVSTFQLALRDYRKQALWKKAYR